MTEQAAPTVTVKCPTPSCEEHNEEKQVQAGTVVGENVLMYGTLSCMVCGANMALVH